MSKIKNKLHGVESVVQLFPKQEEKGVAAISRFEFSSKKDPLFNMRTVRDGGGMFYMYDGHYVRLHVNGKLMMSDTSMERISNMGFIEGANGRVLIAGLGVGLIIHNIIEREKVKEVVVVEKYQDVIDLVHPKIQHPKLKVVCADIFEYELPKEEKFDTIYFDIWANISTENLDQMKTLHAKFRKNLNKTNESRWMDSWMKDYLMRQRTKERREERQSAMFYNALGGKILNPFGS